MVLVLDYGLDISINSSYFIAVCPSISELRLSFCLRLALYIYCRLDNLRKLEDNVNFKLP